MTGKLRLRWADSRLLDVAAALLAAVGVLRLVSALPTRTTQNDFAHYYSTGRLLLEGRNPYGVPLEYSRYGFAVREDPVPSASYTPAFVWLFAPIAAMPREPAFWSWVGVQIVCLALVLWFSRQLLGNRLTRRGWWFIGCGTLACAAVYWHFYYSQVQLLLAALLLAAYSSQRDGKHAVACGLVTIAGLLKLFPFVMLPWFVWRAGDNVRARVRALAVCLAVCASVVALTGPGLWRGFYQHGLEIAAVGAVNHSFNYSVPSLVLNIGYAFSSFDPTAAAKNLLWLCATLAGAAVILLAYIRCSAQASLNGEREFCLLSVAMLLGSWVAWGHYFVLLIFPLSAAAAWVIEHPTSRRIVGMAALVVLLNCVATVTSPWLDRHLLVKVLANNMPLVGMLGLGLFFATDWNRSAESL